MNEPGGRRYGALWRSSQKCVLILRGLTPVCEGQIWAHHVSHVENEVWRLLMALVFHKTFHWPWKLEDLSLKFTTNQQSNTFELSLWFVGFFTRLAGFKTNQPALLFSWTISSKLSSSLRNVLSGFVKLSLVCCDLNLLNMLFCWSLEIKVCWDSFLLPALPEFNRAALFWPFCLFYWLSGTTYWFQIESSML